MYDTADYAGSRLNGTVILLKRQPVYVEQVRNRDGCKMVYGTTMGRGHHAVQEDLAKFNVTDYRLGYFNKNGVAYYMSRKAMRQDWRQGLRPNNVQVTPHDRGVEVEDIALCLRQRFPSLSGALAKLGEGHESCAWCKDFAVQVNGIVFWKAHPCGIVEDDTITLNDRYKFLTKLIKESTHECYEII